MLSIFSLALALLSDCLSLLLLLFSLLLLFIIPPSKRSKCPSQTTYRPAPRASFGTSRLVGSHLPVKKPWLQVTFLIYLKKHERIRFFNSCHSMLDIFWPWAGSFKSPWKFRCILECLWILIVSWNLYIYLVWFKNRFLLYDESMAWRPRITWYQLK